MLLSVRLFLISITIVLSASHLSAQVENTEVTRSLPSIQFGFGNPGARSLGMGGAFLALADDASAAEANPAGLTILRKTELSLEFRDATQDRSIPLRGTYPGIESGSLTTSTRLSQVSFASIVYPLEKYSIAGYYHRVVGFRIAPVLREPVFYNVDTAGGGLVSSEVCARLGSLCKSAYLQPEEASLHGDLETFGVAAARAFGPFSLGAAMRYERYSQGGFIVPFNLAGVAFGRFSQTASGGDFTFSAGAKWTPISGVSLGAVYKQGSNFHAPLTYEPIGGGARFLIADLTRHFPSIAGVGISVRPAPSLTFNADAIRIGYRKFGKSSIVNDQTLYRLRDGTELRFGAEYFIITRVPIALRAGWWRDPAHTLEYVGPVNTLQGGAASLIYPRASQEDHYSLGAGFSWERFQVDAAYDTARDAHTASVSVLARF
ncbi:MAG TPA: UPF0164 family protein [Thermoanaerobaculia bacterium]|nr:UPF0164 family protein [Thermoanaerobaculia bacterium]